MVAARLRLATVAVLLAPTVCLAWGEDGHRIVGDIANQYLTPENTRGDEARGRQERPKRPGRAVEEKRLHKRLVV